MKRYFITDQSGLDWKKRQWAVGNSHTETNENYWFSTFDDPLVALFLDPACDQTENPKLWQVEISGEKIEILPRILSSNMKVVGTVEDALPTPEQYVAFGIVCALNLVADKTFSNWAINWLKNIDRTKETAEKIHESLELPDDCSSAAWPALASVAKDQPAFHSAAAALRSFYDSPEKDPIELKQIARIVATMTTQEIGTLLGGEEDGRVDQ